jgi:hypothetical protein
MPRPAGETNRRLTDDERREKAKALQARAARRTREQEKREQLRAELRAELERPLTPGVCLTPKEREARRERIQTGLISQSLWPRSGSGRTSVAEL